MNERNKSFMSSIETVDFFKNNPVHEFAGAGFEKYRPRWSWERNLRNASLYFIADGSLTFEFGSKSFTAHKNDVVFLKSSDNALIKNSTDSYSSLYYIAFKYDEGTNLGLSTIYKNTGYLRSFKDILDTHRSGAPLSSLKISHLFLRLLYSLCFDSLQSRKDYIITSRIQSAAEYININYYKNINIEQLCRITGYSPAHLRRLFIKTFGASPQNYILDKRIEVAKEMLLDVPEKTVDEIADLLGMSSTSYLCKLFKAKTGLSPTEYRKNLVAKS